MDTRQEELERLRIRIDACKRQVGVCLDEAHQALVVNDFAKVLAALRAGVYAAKKAEAWRSSRVRVVKAVAAAEVKKGDERI